MRKARYITRLKLFAELKKFSLKSEKGGGLGALFIAFAAILLATAVIVGIADYSILTYKRNAISKALDYAVTAAVQQIENNKSKIGIAKGFSEETGESMLEGVEIDIDKARNIFIEIFFSNYKTEYESIDKSLLLCATSTQNGELNYKIKVASEPIIMGTLNRPSLIEDKINDAIDQGFSVTEKVDHVFINGNPKTNLLDNGTYLFAFLKDIQITGLYTKKYISLSSLCGAKIER